MIMIIIVTYNNTIMISYAAFAEFLDCAVLDPSFPKWYNRAHDHNELKKS